MTLGHSWSHRVVEILDLIPDPHLILPLPSPPLTLTYLMMNDLRPLVVSQGGGDTGLLLRLEDTATRSAIPTQPNPTLTPD